MDFHNSQWIRTLIETFHRREFFWLLRLLLYILASPWKMGFPGFYILGHSWIFFWLLYVQKMSFALKYVFFCIYCCIYIWKYGANGITEYELRNGIAEISDDTQMTLFTATGLLPGSKFILHQARLFKYSSARINTPLEVQVYALSRKPSPVTAL